MLSPPNRSFPIMSSSTTNTRRSARIKKRKIVEKSTSDNTCKTNDNNGTTKQKKCKTDKNGNGQCQLHHDDGKLDDDAILPFNETVYNKLQQLEDNFIYWLCYLNQVPYYILLNSSGHGQEEELRHIPNLVDKLVSYYSQQADCVALLDEHIDTVDQYDEEKYYSIDEFDESMPDNYFITHSDLDKSDDATVQDDDDDEQSTTTNASTNGKDDEQNTEVESINDGISMEVELSTNNDIPPKTTFKSLDNCKEKNVRPSPTSAIDDLSPFTDESEKRSNNKSITTLQQSTTPTSKLNSGKSSLLQLSPASAFRTVPQQHTLPPLKSPQLQSSPVSKHREQQSTSQTLNDDDVPNSHTTVDIQEVDDDTLDDKSNLKSDHIDTQLVDESPTAALDLDTNLSTEKEEVQVSGDSRDDSHHKSEIQQPCDIDASSSSTPTNEAVVLSQHQEDLSILTVVQLQDRLRGLNLAVGGRKQELIDRLNKYLYPNVAENKEDALPTKLSPAAASQLETPSSLLVIPDIWGQSHELGPILSSIFTKLRKEHGTTSFCVIWNGMREKYTKIDYVKSTKPNDPFLVHQKELDDAKSKFVYLMDITHTQMRKEGKGPISDAEEELWGLSSILGILHLQEIHPIIGEDCNDDGQFRLRKLNELKGELRGQYRLLKDLNDIINGRWKIGISNRKVEGMLRRIWEQLFPSSTDRSVEHEVEEGLVEEEEGATVTQKKDKIDISKMMGVAGFFYNLAESLKMNDKSPLLKEIVELAALITPSLQVHNDNKDDANAEGTNFFMESSLSSMFSCSPGPVLEKLLNLGSTTVRGICQSPPQDISDRNEEFTTEVSDTEEFDHILSWTTEKSSVYAVLLKLKQDGVDDATILAIEAMIRPMHKGEFLQWYEIQTLFDGSSTLNRFVNAYGSEGFKAVEQAADEIRQAIASNAKPEVIQQVIYTAIASIDKKSSLGARYIEPTNKSAYRDGCYTTLKNKRDAASTSNKKKVIVIEKEVINQLSNEEKAELLPPDSKKYHLYNNDRSIACTLYKYKHNGKTIKILVTPSWHCIHGAKYILQSRINNGQSYITFMRSLTNANISSSAALLKQVQIFHAQLIEMEGFGNLEKGTKNCSGSVWKAIRNALPKGLCCNYPIRGGVASLGKSISPVNGIDSLKVVCLVAVLGIADFTSMMKIGYDIDFHCTDFSTSLLALSPWSFRCPDTRLRVAAALKDDVTNQRCAMIAGLPKDWLAYKSSSHYAIRAPDGKCFSGFSKKQGSIARAPSQGSMRKPQQRLLWKFIEGCPVQHTLEWYNKAREAMNMDPWSFNNSIVSHPVAQYLARNPTPRWQVDVLPSGWSDRPGNVHFQHIIDTLKPIYQSDHSKLTILVDAVLKKMQSDGRRFLNLDYETVKWKELDVAAARERVASLLTS